MAVSRKKFEARTDLPNTHPLTSYLCKLIVAKKTNLCLSADVSSSSALIKVAEEVGDYICVLKTHADAIDDFGEKTAKRLKEIARRKKFLIFEDRKFGDIGSTVQKQYSRGPLRIAEWAHIVNAHVFPGPAIITALKQASEMTLKSLSQSVSTEVYVGTPMASEGDDDDEEENARQGVQASRPEKSNHAFTRKGSIVTTTHIYQTVEPREGHRSPNRVRSPPNESALDEEEDDDEIDEPPMLRGLLLLAQMSSAGNLMNESYSKACAEMARANRDFVMGFITQETLNQEGDNFLCLAPGVNLPAAGAEAIKGDALGQQYRTPKMVIGQGIDIIIVGRGILSASDRAKEARRYRDETWAAYESLVES